MSNGSWLVMSQGPQPGQSFMLDKNWLTLGRDPSNDITINDPQVSRQHARITRQGRMTVIEDLGSTNGTFVNGMRLTGPHVMSNGDVIGLGDAVTLTYYEEDQRADATETVVGRVAAAPPPTTAYRLSPRPASQPPSYTTPPPYIPAPYAATPSPPAAPAPAPTAYPVAPPPPPQEALPAETQKKKSKTWLWIGCGALALAALCLAVALGLWFAPPEFWNWLFELLGIPLPT